MASSSITKYEKLVLPLEHFGATWRYANDGIVRRRHYHDELEVNLVMTGSAQYLINDQRFDLHPHMQVWLFPAQQHVLLDQSPNFTMWIGLFKPALVETICTVPHTRTLRDHNPSGNFCKQLEPNAALRLAHLCEEIAQGSDDNPRFNAGIAYFLLLAWTHYLHASVAVAGRSVHPAVEKAVYLLREAVEPVRADQLACRVGLSVSRLSNLFKQHTGVTLTDFRNRQCLERFFLLYSQDHAATISEVALAAGFGSYAQFYRVFARTMGYGPAQYRRGIGR